MIRLGAVNFHATLTFWNRWLHWIRVCKAMMGMVFILKLWNLPLERFWSSPNVALWLYSTTCFSCLCMVARAVAKKKFCVLEISGVLHWIWIYFHTSEVLSAKCHLGIWCCNHHKFANDGRCLRLLDHHDVLVPLSRTTIPILPNIVLMPLLKLSQILYDFVCEHYMHIIM